MVNVQPVVSGSIVSRGLDINRQIPCGYVRNDKIRDQRILFSTKVPIAAGTPGSSLAAFCASDDS